MAKTDKRIDVYIDEAAEFAQPILDYLRSVIHETCSDVQETMKWNAPHFEYAGGILCGMAAFKNHCAFGFWLGSMMKDDNNLLMTAGDKTAMGHFGKLKSVKDLPSKKILKAYVKQAMDLNEKGVKRTKPDVIAKAKNLVVPDYFLKTLSKNKKALATFEKFSYSHRKEYIEWITEAKTEETRNKRMATAVEWLTEGKGRHWKYQQGKA